MEAAHAHLRTLDWVLHQEPYDGSDAQASVDREEEMIRMREVEQDVDMEESEEEVSCAFNTKDISGPASLVFWSPRWMMHKSSLPSHPAAQGVAPSSPQGAGKRL